MAADFSLKKIIELLLTIFGVFLLIFILFQLASSFLPKEEVTEAQQDADAIADAIEHLKKIGDFTKVSFQVKSGGCAKTFKLYSTSDRGKPYIEVTTCNKDAAIIHRIKYLDILVCQPNKISKEPCVEGQQYVSALEKPDGDVIYTEWDLYLFDKIPRRSGYIINKKAIELRVSDTGRILLLAPS